MMYFFHNVYGEEDELISTIPEGIEAVPFGWTEEEEGYRNDLLDSLNASISTLPSLLVFIPEHFVKASSFDQQDLISLPQDHRVVGWHKVPARWVEFDINIIKKPWTWSKILDSVKSYHV